jgi:hypothetical protein
MMCCWHGQISGCRNQIPESKLLAFASKADELKEPRAQGSL